MMNIVKQGVQSVVEQVGQKGPIVSVGGGSTAVVASMNMNFWLGVTGIVVSVLGLFIQLVYVTSKSQAEARLRELDRQIKMEQLKRLREDDSENTTST